MENDASDADAGASRQSKQMTGSGSESKEAVGCVNNLDAANDSASSTGGSCGKSSSKPLARDVHDVSPSEERKTRKRRNDVLYSRSRRQRERNEADSLREHSAMLTRTNEALKKEETRLLHLYVDATKTIEELSGNVDGRTKTGPSPDSKMAATGLVTSQSDKVSTAVRPDDHATANPSCHQPSLSGSLQTAASDPSSALASLLPLLLQHASNMQISSPALNFDLSQISGSIHPWFLQELLQRHIGNLSLPSSSIPQSDTHTTTRLVSEQNRGPSSLSGTIFGSSTGRPATASDSFQTRNGPTHRLDSRASETGTPFPPVPLSSDALSQNTSVEAALLESLVCTILSGSPTAERPTAENSHNSNSEPPTAVPRGLASHELPGFSSGESSITPPAIASSQSALTVSGEGNRNLLVLLETLLAARNNANTS